MYLFYVTFGLCHWIVFKGCFWTLKILNDFEKLWAAIDLVRSKIKWVVDKAFSDLLCGLVPFMLLCVLRCSFVFLKFAGLHGRSILFLFYAAVEHFINVFNDGTEIFLFSGKRLYRNGLHFYNGCGTLLEILSMIVSKFWWQMALCSLLCIQYRFSSLYWGFLVQC